MPDDTTQSDELKRKVEELKRKAMEEESRRIEEKVEQRAIEMAKLRLEKERAALQQELKAAETERLREEEALRKRQEEAAQKLDQIRNVKDEAYRKEREEQRRKEEEELRQREADDRERKEEKSRRAAEEEQVRLEEDARHKAEEQRRREEENLRRQEDERSKKESERQLKEEEGRRLLAEEIRRKEEARRKQIEERENRIRSLVASAQVFFENKEYENASVEIAKALVNDPNHPEALELEQKIREALGKAKTEEVVERSRTKEVIQRVSRDDTAPKKKSVSMPLIAVVLLVAAAVVTVVVLQLKKRVFEKPPTFAVMPWKSVTGIEEEAVLGSSLAEELTKQLQNLPQLSIMGYSSAYGLASSVLNSQQAVFRLGYENALVGTIARSETGYLVEVKLIDSLGTVKWRNRYQKSVDSLQVLPGEIALQVAAALQVPSESQPSPGAANPTGVNADAYMAFLKGLEIAHHQTNQATKEALNLFKEALDQDGKFSRALVAAANVQGMRYERGWDTVDAVLFDAQHWAEQAIDASAGLGEGHQALGRIMSLRHEFQSALHEFDVALQLESNNSDVYLDKAKVLLILGKYNDAVDALNHAYNLNPRDAEVLKTFAFTHQLKGSGADGFWYHITALYFVPDSTEYLVGPFADAILFEPDLLLSQGARVADACKRRSEADPGDYVSQYRLARMEQVNGNGMEAYTILTKVDATLEKLLQTQPKNTDVIMYLALTLTRLGKYPEAIVLATKAMNMESKNAIVRYRVAQMYSVQLYSQKKKEIDPKKKEEALKALRQAVVLSFRPDELSNGDFYNLSGQPEFRSTIAQKLQ